MNTTKTRLRCGLLIGVLAAALPASAQTQVDLGMQSKNVDFSNAASTRPAKTGAALPATCAVGDLFFLTGAPAGQNLYGCASGNAWSQLGGFGSGAASQLGDFAATNTSSTIQTLGAGCSAATPCQIRIGSLVFTMTNPATLTLSGTVTSATVYWYLSPAQVLTAGHNSVATLTCSQGCKVASGITAFPADSVPLWQTTFASNAWDAIAPATMDKRAFLSRNVIAPGDGIASVADSATGAQILSTDPTIVPRYFTGSGAPSMNCTAGRDFFIDTSGAHLYFCSSANTWTQAH